MSAKKILAAVVGTGLAVLVEPVFAKGIGEVFSAAHGQLQGAADLISGGAYVGGAATGVSALLKLRNYSENPQQTRLSKPLVLMVVSGGLLALPSMLDSNASSLGLQQSSLEKGVLK